MRVLSPTTLLLAALSVGASITGCSSCGRGTSEGPEASAPLAEPEVPVPEGLLANVWVRGPDAFWSKIQSGASGAIALLPPTLGELASAAGGLDSRVAALVDGKGTTYAAVAEGPGGTVAWTVALPLSDPFGARSILAPSGDGQAPLREVSGFRVLPPGERASSVVLALGSRWLVLAGTEGDLGRLGPYVVGTLPKAPAPTAPGAVVVDVPQSALAGPLSRRLTAAWADGRAWLVARDDEQRAKHGGRPPDFGDPRVIVDAVDGMVKRREALVASARHAQLVVDADDDDVHAELTLTPGTDAASAAALASLHPGVATPLGDLPADAIAAVMVRDDASSRGDDTAALESTMTRALGDRLHADDTHALHAAMGDWARGRGDWWAAAVAWGGSDATRGGWLRGPATDPDAANRAVREAVDLSHRPGLTDLLAGSLHLSPSSVGATDVPSFGKASIATFASTGPAPKAPAPSFGVGWGVHDGQLMIAAGPSPARLLATEAEPPKRIADLARSARALASVGDAATFTLFARPLLLDLPRGSTEAALAPVVFAFGRRGDDVWAHLELADVLLRELLHLQAGL